MRLDPLGVIVALELAIEDRTTASVHPFQAQHVFDDLGLGGEDPALASHVTDRWGVHLGVAQGQAHLVLQLAAAGLDHDDVACPIESPDGGRRSGTATT